MALVAENKFFTVCELKGAPYQNSIRFAAECCVSGQPCPPFSRRLGGFTSNEDANETYTWKSKKQQQ
jgi:hypothetical protein